MNSASLRSSELGGGAALPDSVQAGLGAKSGPGIALHCGDAGVWPDALDLRVGMGKKGGNHFRERMEDFTMLMCCYGRRRARRDEEPEEYDTADAPWRF
jgi:hypothetical protein